MGAKPPVPGVLNDQFWIAWQADLRQAWALN